MFQYDMLARSLAHGNGFRWYAPADLAQIAPYLHLNINSLNLDPRGIITTFRAPLYPGFLSLIYYFNGINNERFFAARLAQTILGALLAPLTYFTSLILSSKRFSNETLNERTISPGNQHISRIAAWVVALYPTLLIYPLALATENLFFLLVLASMLTLLKLAQFTRETKTGSSILYSLLSGLLLGLAALTRSVILPFAGLAILWIWLSLKLPRRAVLAGVALVITVTPWIIRNSLIAGKLTSIETSMGYNLYVGYHPLSTGTFIFGPSLDLLSILNDQTRDELGTQKAIEFIRQDPARFPYLALRRLGYFFNLELRAFTYFYVNNFLGSIPASLLILILIILGAPFAFLSLSAVFGGAILPNRPETVLLALLLIGYLLPHVFILSEERFHLTLIPFFAICAANIWVYGFNSLKSRGNFVVLIAGIIAILLIINWGFELSRDGQVIVQMISPNGNQLYLAY
jgi:4-amino-4-deoxy-L-arabinose transferase-like glycosyltransferase